MGLRRGTKNLFKFSGVLDSTIVTQGDPALVVHVWVCIRVSAASVSRPSCVLQTAYGHIDRNKNTVDIHSYYYSNKAVTRQ